MARAAGTCSMDRNWCPGLRLPPLCTLKGSALTSARSRTFAQTAFFGEVGAQCGVLTGDHWVIAGQVPFGPVLRRRLIMNGLQVPFEHFHMQTALQADNMVIEHCPGRSRGRPLGLGR